MTTWTSAIAQKTTEWAGWLLRGNGTRSAATTAAAAVATLYGISFVFGDLPYLVHLWRKCPPGARPLPVLANYLPFGLDRWLAEIFFNLNHPFERCLREVRQYGRVFAHREMLGSWDIVVTDPEDVAYILARNFDNFNKGKILTDFLFKDFLGKGIFNVNGDEWRAHRRLAKGQFDKVELSNMIPTFWRHLECLSSHLADGSVVNMQDLFFRFTLDSVGEILFGTNVNSLAQNTSFALAFDRIQYHVILRAVLYPFSRVFTSSEYKRDLAALDKYCDDLVDSCLADAALPERRDMLAEYVKSETAEGTAPSREYLRDMLKNMLIAGRDTTAVLLTWTVYELSRAPHVVDKILAEIRSVAAEEGHIDAATPPSQAFLGKLKYLKQVFNEVLRLHPSVPTDVRCAVEDCVLPSGYFVPAGTNCDYPIYVMGRMEEYWGADCLSFDPDRWETGCERLRKVPAILQSIAFNSGPRMCLGQNMAYTEAKSALVFLLYVKALRFHVIDIDKVEYFSAIILSCKGGLKVKVSSAAAAAATTAATAQ